MYSELGFKVAQIKGLGPRMRLHYGKFGLPEKYSSYVLLAEYIDIWYEASLGQGDSIKFAQIKFLGS